MVKVFEREFDESQESLEERATRLYVLASNLLKNVKVINFEETISIDNGEIDVYPHIRAITVYTKKNYGRAKYNFERL